MPPRTPDRTPGPSLEEETQYEDRTSDGPPTVTGAVRFYGGDLVVKLPAGVTSLTSGTGSPHPVSVAAVDPTATDDSSSGFAIGHHWVNTAALPPRAFQATDVSVAAAKWVRVTNLQHNVSANRPTADDDGDDGYEIGSLWFHTSSRELSVCIDASVATALWRLVGDVGTHTIAGVVFYGGSVAVYPTIASDLDNEVQYVAVRLQAGKTYDRMVVFVDSGGLAGRTIQLGVYDQTIPFPIAAPADRVATTDSVSTVSANGTYFEVQITDGAGSPQVYTVPVDGIYWLALVQSSNAVKFAATALFRSNFLPRRREAGASSLLPATASGLSNPAAALILVALIEPGVVVSP